MNPRDTLIGAMRAHQAGDLRTARSAYETVLATEAGHPDALHYLGVLDYQEGLLERAAERVRRAQELKPDDPAIAANLGLIYQALDLWEDAENAYRASLDLDPGQPEAWFNLGLLHRQQQRPLEASRCFDQALTLQPAHAQARRERGLAHLALGDGGRASADLRACAAGDPGNRQLRYELGRARELTEDLDSAADDYRRAADGTDHTSVLALCRLSVVARRLGQPDEALRTARAALGLAPDEPEALRALGHCLKAAGRLEDAADSYRAAHERFRAPGAADGPVPATFTTTTRAKLRHDLEQLRWLGAQGLPVHDLPAITEACAGLLQRVPADAADGELIRLPEAPGVADWYNRCLYLEPTPVPEGPVLGETLDRHRIESDYHRRQPGITWVDDFLSPGALAALRRFCLASTIWYDCDHPRGYLGAYLQDGFNCPLLLAVATELSSALPGIFGDHRLMQLWAYKYDSQMAGIDIHADFAAINVNFWITPSEANLDAERGGMIIWDVEAPLEWTMDEYNTYDPVRQETLRAFLEKRAAGEIVIPHRQNRCAIFNSNLLHRTDDIRFRDGYENRRINITMLFGHRGD